jgi:hypothetical protein
MDMGITFVANLQASERVKPCNRAPDWPTRFAQATAMGRANLCKCRRDAAFSQTLAVRLRAVAPVALNDSRLMQRTSPIAATVWNGIDECIKLSEVVTVRPSQDDRERDTFRVDDEVVFAAELASVRWIRAGFFPPAWCESTSCPQALVTSRFRHDDAVRPARFRGCVARLLLPAMPRAFASRQCPNRIPSLAVAGSTQCPSAARIRYRLERLGSVSVFDRHIGDCAVLAQAAAVR